MVGTCRPIAEGGIGFDYRLGMGIPDMWIEILKTKRDEDWPIGHIVHVLSDRYALRHLNYYKKNGC